MRRLNFIHFVIDDKFIPDSIKCFDDADLTNNDFYYYSNRGSDFRFLDRNRVKLISNREIESLLNNNEVDVVCLHSLFSLPCKYINMINSKIKVIWYAWGADLYSNPKPTGPLINIGERLLDKTKHIAKQPFTSRTYDKLKYILKSLLGKNNTKEDVFSAINRIDYFSGVFPSEYDLLKKSCKAFRAEPITHNYIHPEEFQIKDINEPCNITGKNILLGNSAAIYNNHLDIIDLVAPFVRSDIKIISPLSYQGTPRYINSVIEYGYNVWGKQFVPLKGYLPLNEYTTIMNSCDSIILGQKQQAATCNCLSALWNGLKLFLLKDSMNYNFYKSIGLTVFSIEYDFPKSPIMSMEDILKNRSIIEGLYSFRKWKEDLKECVQKIINS